MGWRRRPPRRLHPQLVLHGPLARTRAPPRSSSSTRRPSTSSTAPRSLPTSPKELVDERTPLERLGGRDAPARRRGPRPRPHAHRQHRQRCDGRCHPPAGTRATRTLETRRCRGQSMSCEPSSPSCASASPASQMRWPADCGPRATHGPKHNASPTRRARESPNSSGDPAPVCVAARSINRRWPSNASASAPQSANERHSWSANESSPAASPIAGLSKPSAQPGARAPQQSRRQLAVLGQQERRAALEPSTAPYLTVALGPLPEHSRGRHIWDQAAHRIEAYRFERGISDPRTALGARSHWRLRASTLAASAARPRARSASAGPRRRSRPGPPALRTRCRPSAVVLWHVVVDGALLPVTEDGRGHAGGAAMQHRSPRGRTPPRRRAEPRSRGARGRRRSARSPGDLLGCRARRRVRRAHEDRPPYGASILVPCAVARRQRSSPPRTSTWV